ncbi:alanine--tRNA ligase [Nevskia soli]|uniref:alanine--tRNA ligase n=1 Tax=Nevskia soli TaxID=418856 RepID=UPI0004A77040
MNSNELRSRFLEYFRSQGHTVVPSSPLVPGNDPTLLFTNAGMVQFKDVFTGRETRSYKRATSSQKCLRAGGKHNDLENVGYTARHHTFFEMLGNFSFGDYFKEDAIRFAWEFITGKDWLNLPKSRLLVTVYHSDDEAYELWHKKIGMPPERIVRIGDKPGGGSDNFWQMGDTGPCGPCTEIFYDHDPDGSKGIAGGPPGSPEEDGDRWIEIWNLVFMQFDRAPDGTLSKLPAPSVDTGMGLERVAAVMQGVHNNYDIDLFKTLIGAVAKLANVAPDFSPSLKVIADHIRATSFLICDGVVPSNEGRGYVLRRIMRRAIRHGYKLGLNEPFFYKLVAPLGEVMGGAYPDLVEKRAVLERVIKQEEEAFAATLDKGMRLLEDAIARSGGAKAGVIPGDVAFKLYDTYGFPLDLTADIARERGLSLDTEGYEREMKAQQDRSRAGGNFTADYSQGAVSNVLGDARTEFTGYEHEAGAAKVLAIIRNGQAVERIEAGDEAVVFLDRTPFYAESGGQVGDTGALTAPGMRFAVSDTQALNPNARGHIGKLESGVLRTGDNLKAEVDSVRRDAVRRNHSATHLLHAALRSVLGAHVAQKGSLVSPERLRFDFSHDRAMTAEEIAEVERLVNREVLANIAADIRLSSYDEAVAAGAMALFGEKYGDVVRVLKFGDFSTELCGGIHVSRTGDIGLFKIVGESGVAAGIRRVEGVTGQNALAYVRELEGRLREAAAVLRSGRDDLVDKAQQLLDRNKQLEKDLAQLKGKLASSAGSDLAGQARDIKGVKVLSARVDGVEGNDLRTLMDQLKNKLGSGVVLLGSASGAKVSLIAGVSADLTAKVKAGELVNMAATQVGGKGGGRPDMAQAGGTQPEHLDAAVQSVYAWVESKL